MGLIIQFIDPHFKITSSTANISTSSTSPHLDTLSSTPMNLSIASWRSSSVMSSPNDSELLSFSETGKYSVPYVVKSVGWRTRMLVTSGWSHGVLDSQLSYHTCCINALEINLTTVQKTLKFSMLFSCSWNLHKKFTFTFWNS